MYGLDSYTEQQKKNWSLSERIVIYHSDLQFLNFIDDVLANGNNSKKIYFGKIPWPYANIIEQKTGVNVAGYNLAIRASEIIKIFKTHNSQ